MGFRNGVLAGPVVYDLYKLAPITNLTHRLYVVDIVRPSTGQRNDIISLQHDARSTTPQAFITVSSAKLLKLVGRKIGVTCVLCDPSLTTIVGFESLNLFDIVFKPFFAAGNYLFTILLVVGASVKGCTGAISPCPGFLVFGGLFFVLFLILSTCLDPVGQIAPRPFIIGVLLLTVAPIPADAALDARLAFPRSSI